MIRRLSLLAPVLFLLPALWLPPRIEVVVAGVPDPDDAAVGDEVSLRCRVVDENGDELRRLPDGTRVEDLELTLELDRGPEDGFDGRIQGASAHGTLTREGLYVFRCLPSDPVAAERLETRPGVVVVRPPTIEEAATTLRRMGDFRPLTTFEVGETIRLQYRAFADEAPDRPVRPSSTQVLVRRGRVGCGSDDAPLALDDFRAVGDDGWSSEDGTVERWVPRQTGSFTFVVTQSDGQGTSVCRAAAFDVVRDARAPEVAIEHPPDPTLPWDHDAFRVSGIVVDNGARGVDELEVSVSNGHWSVDAYVSDAPAGEDRYGFDANLPWTQGLQVVEVVARDATGHVGRDLATVYAGDTWIPIETEEPEEAGLGTVSDLVLQPGRGLLRDTEGPVDSLHELVALAPLLLEAYGGVELPGPTHVDREVENSVVVDITNLLRPSFDVAGSIVPGRPEFGLLPAADALELHVGLPMGGQVVMQCQGRTISLDRALCAVAGEPDGRFHVNPGGAVDVQWGFRPTAAGRLGLETDFTEDLEVVDRLSISNGLDEAEINEAFREEIVSEVRTNVDELIQRLWGCLDEEGSELDRCDPSAPFEISTEQIEKTMPAMAWVRLFGGELVHAVSFGTDHPVPGAGSLDVTLPFRFELLGMTYGRVDMLLAAGAHFAPVGDLPGRSSVLLDHGPRGSGAIPSETPAMQAWFGSGDRDLQGAVHLNVLNQALAQLWAAGPRSVSFPLFDVLDDAGFFSDGLMRDVARSALADVRLEVRLEAPPRVTYYDGATAPYLEVGAVEIELDFTEHYDSRLVLEAGLVAELDLSATDDGQGLAVALSDPTGCEPDPGTFMSCRGRFEVGIVERKGLHEWTPRPDILQRDESMDQFLTQIGVKDDQGDYRSRRELERHVAGLLEEVVSNLLADSYTVDLPDLPVPRVDFGDLQLAPLDLANLTIHEEADGGKLSDGWIGFALDVDGRTGDE